MSVIVTDSGFGPDDWTGGADAERIDLGPADDPAAFLREGVAMISVAFPAFSDGRGFTIARQLRAMGYAGRLRAVGHVLADQYAMARRAGFDEVEISDALATRQPEAHWLARADWRAHDYQSRLRV